jgi:plasmid stabilization system protein ParE
MSLQSPQYSIRFTEPAIQSIEDQADHLAYSGINALGEDAANQRIQAILDQIPDKLANSPRKYPVAPELVDLAIFDHRRVLIERYRVFYDIHETTHEVAILMLVHETQSVEKALIRYCLMAPAS